MAFRPRLSIPWAWGTAEGALSPEERELVDAYARHRFGVTEAPRLPRQSVDLPPARIGVPDSLAGFVIGSAPDRAAHAWGKSFVDLARARDGRADFAPDLVAYPSGESEVVALLEWASTEGVAVIPYGGGSSVVGGVTPDVGAERTGSVSLDLQRLDDVLEVDAVSRAARVQAGILGPALADGLREHGLSLRHYPQSYEFSSLGGWIATRSGGHYATGRTRIDDFVEAVRVVSPAGAWQTLRVPSSGAGPDPVRMALGSEGALGVITEAWVRLNARPAHSASAVVHFEGLAAALGAVRALAQSDLAPANLRLLDRAEAATSFVNDGSAEVLLLGFESADYPVDERLHAALQCCADHGGTARSGSAGTGSWRSAFLRMPYLRDALMDHAIVCETFETACTWDRAESVVETIRSAVTGALASEGLDPSSVSFRFTHAYPDGIAPYVTVLARGRHGDLVRPWHAVKAAASDAIAGSGATITHHHAVGRDHMPWYLRETPTWYAASLAAARATLDPAGIMNPGVLLAGVVPDRMD